MSVPELSAGERLQIQMAYAVPLLKRLQDILGHDVVPDALREDTRRRTDMVARGFGWFGGNGLLDYNLIANDADDMRIGVHRCSTRSS
jgi:hypothetical protein